MRNMNFADGALNPHKRDQWVVTPVQQPSRNVTATTGVRLLSPKPFSVN